MSDEQPPWMGCAAHDAKVVEISMDRFAREFADHPNAWPAAHATLLHQKPVRFELEGGEGYYLAPYDPNHIGLNPGSIIRGHIKLEELMPVACSLPTIRTERMPAEILRPYRVLFNARVPCEVLIHAASEADAKRRAAQDFEGSANRLLRTAHASLETWAPLPRDFDFVRAEPAQ